MRVAADAVGDCAGDGCLGDRLAGRPKGSRGPESVAGHRGLIGGSFPSPFHARRDVARHAGPDLSGELHGGTDLRDQRSHLRRRGFVECVGRGRHAIRSAAPGT